METFFWAWDYGGLRLWTVLYLTSEQVQIQYACVLGRTDAGCSLTAFSTLHWNKRFMFSILGIRIRIRNSVKMYELIYELVFPDVRTVHYIIRYIVFSPSHLFRFNSNSNVKYKISLCSDLLSVKLLSQSLHAKYPYMVWKWMVSYGASVGGGGFWYILNLAGKGSWWHKIWEEWSFTWEPGRPIR